MHLMRSSKKKSVVQEKSKSVDLFRTMIDSCPVWISFVDADGKYLIANDYYTKTFNLPLSQVEGHNFKEFFPPDLYVRHKQLLDMCFNKREPVEWEDKHNPEVYTYGIYTPLINEDGSIRGLVAFGLDITKLKQTEFELIKEKKNLEEVITKLKMTEEELKKYRNHLEELVVSRTSELKQKTVNLEETNVALKVLLEQRKADKKEIEKNMLNKIEKLVFPYLDKLKEKKRDHEEYVYINIIESNLKEITSHISPDLFGQFSKLTKTEIQIADMIRMGKATKEIAELLKLSPTTIATHRQNIRKKLALTNKKMNLRTALSTNK